MDEEAKKWAEERFKLRDLEGDITDQVDYAVIIVRIYEDYLNAFEPLSLRALSEVHSVAQRLETWAKP